MSLSPRRLARRWSLLVAIVLLASSLAFTIANGAVGTRAVVRRTVRPGLPHRRATMFTKCATSLDDMGPCGFTVHVAVNATGSKSYYYDNNNTFEPVSAGITCTPIAPVSSCTAIPSSLNVDAGGSGSFQIQFSATNGGTGKVAVQLSASTTLYDTITVLVNALSVTPDGSPVTALPNGAGAQQFQVHNLGATSAIVSFSLNCSGSVSCTLMTTGPITIAAHDSGAVSVVYGTGAPGTSGVVGISASISGQSTSTDGGSVNVTVPLPQAAVLSAAPQAGSARYPGLCVSSCFDVTAAYTTPAYTSFDAPRSATLVYSSAQAHPMGLVQVDATDPSARPAQQLGLSLQRSDGTLVTFTNDSTELRFTGPGAGATARLAGQFDATALATGVYHYTAIVKSYWTSGVDSGSVKQSSVPVAVLVINEQASPFGAGWSMAGLQRLIFPGTDTTSVVLTEGTGALSVFTRTCRTCAFSRPPGDFSRLEYIYSDTALAGYSRRYPDGTEYRFATTGELLWVADRFGTTVTFHYVDHGPVSAIIDPASDSLTFVYHNGKLASITDPGGRVSQFVVNGTSGDLTSITDPRSGTPFQGVYDTAHRLTQLTDRAGETWLYRYDFASKLASDSTPPVLADGTTQRLGRRYRSLESMLLIDTATHRGTATAPGAAVRSDTLTVLATALTGDSTRARLDAYGAPTRLEVPSLKTVSAFTRDGDEHVTLEADSAKGAQVKRVSTTWNGPRMTSVSNLTSGTSVTYTYDTTYNLVTHVTGSTPEVTNFLNAARTWVDSSRVGPSGDTATTYVHDGYGRVTQVTDPSGHVQSTAFATTGYRNTTSTTANNRVTRYYYDGYGRLVSTKHPTGGIDSVQYDSLNRVVRTVGIDGAVTQIGYDSLTTHTVTDALGQVYQYDRNPVGWLVAVTNANTRDPLLARVDSVYYTRTGLVAAHRNRQNQRTSFTYDDQGRPLTRTLADGRVTTWSYDTAAHYVADSSAESIDTVKTDATGRTVTEFTQQAGRTYTVVSSSDANGLLRTTVLKEGTTTLDSLSYGYDVLRRLDTLRTGTAKTLFRYANDGLLTSWKLPTGDSIVIGYSKNHRPLTQTFSRQALDLIFNESLTRDTLDRVTQIRTYGMGDTARAFAYDTVGRLASYTVTQYDNGETCTRDPNVMDGQICVPNGTSTTVSQATYAYDLVGNRTDLGAGLIPGNRDTTFNGFALTYDADGNLTHKSQAGFDQYLYWNSLGQLDSVSTNGSVVRFGYDAAGRRVRKTTATQAVRYIYSGQQVVAEIDSATGAAQKLYRYYPGVDNPHSVKEAGKTYYYLSAIGQPGVIGLIDSTGALKNRYRYAPWGALEDSLEMVATPLRFAGREYDSETRLYYFRARFYDTALGRFLSEDPAGLDAGINQYAYVADDPLNSTDPSGMWEEDGCRPYTDGSCGHKGGQVTLGNAGDGCSGWDCDDIINAVSDLLSNGVDVRDYSLSDLPDLNAACSNFPHSVPDFCGQLTTQIHDLRTVRGSAVCKHLGNDAQSRLVHNLLRYYDGVLYDPSGGPPGYNWDWGDYNPNTGVIRLSTQAFISGPQQLFLTLAHEEAHAYLHLSDGPQGGANPAEQQAQMCWDAR